MDTPPITFTLHATTRCRIIARNYAEQQGLTLQPESPPPSEYPLNAFLAKLKNRSYPAGCHLIIPHLDGLAHQNDTRIMSKLLEISIDHQITFHFPLQGVVYAQNPGFKNNHQVVTDLIKIATMLQLACHQNLVLRQNPHWRQKPGGE